MKSLAQQLEPSFNRVIAEHKGLEAQLTYITDEFAKHAFQGLLERNLGNVRAAARECGMHHDRLWNLLRKHNIDPGLYVTENSYL